MLHEICYVSSNCNQTPSSAHWGKNNLICYSTCNAVAIYDPNAESGGKIIATLVSHTKRVNSVRWITGTNHETELVSGSADSDAIVWTLKNDHYIPFTLKAHNSNINIVDGLYKGPNRNKAVVVTVSMDSTVKIWFRQTPDDDFILSQNIDYDYSICVGVRISLLTQMDTIILALASDSSKIELYLENHQNTESLTFCLSNTLKGHEDWVRGFDFTTDDNGDIILASSSQDMFIRIWRMTRRVIDKEDEVAQLENYEENLIKIQGEDYRIYTDSVLMGHEGWVYSVNWNTKSFQLLSASLDKSMIIWEIDPESNLWIEKVRVGGVGGNTLGFYGGLFGPDGETILAHSYHGAFHIWNKVNDEWKPSVTLGGHFNEVTDLTWDPYGEFILSVSADQTTRIHAPCPKDGRKATWHEIARPQVHGYDLSSVAILQRYKFASSAEEKVIRTFQAPRNFIENFRRICHIDEDKEGDVILCSEESGPKGASVPSLGLSNKAVFTSDNIDQIGGGDNKKDFYPEESHFTAVTLDEPPTEETLIQNTLWPEIQKLYGHGYEVYSLASSPDGKYLASACKATTAEHAAVLLWDTSNWKQVKKLVSHTLTVAQISFSPDSQHILTVSRDRRWSLFSKNSNDIFELAATTDKKTSIHTRIIWSCSWSHDSKYFATGSRDGKVVVWTKNRDKIKDSILGQYEAASACLELKSESITAVAFAPSFVFNLYLIAIGLESGVIEFYKWSPVGWESVLNLDKSLAHHLTVKRLAFRPIFGRAGFKNDKKNILQLASCSSDYSVRIHNLFLK